MVPVVSWICRMVLPPGPISKPILSASILVLIRRGAYSEISSLGRDMVFSIARRISIRASFACTNAARMMSSEIPVIFRSSWIPVIPFWVPATLKSISPKWSSSPRMSVSNVHWSSDSRTSPTEIPATGFWIGTPADIRPKVAPQTEAIDDEPLDSRISEMTRTV